MSHGLWAIVLAGGRGARFGGDRPKQLLPLAGRPVLAHALDALLNLPLVSAAVVPCAPELRAALLAEVMPRLTSTKVVHFVDAGSTRQASVRAGLAALPRVVQWVMVHDGARPNPGAKMITRLWEARSQAAAVIPALPVTDTVKRVDPTGRVIGTVERSELVRVQTPQLFDVATLKRAHEAAAEGAATDDAALIEALGLPVQTVRGNPGNLKLTLPGDQGPLEYWIGTEEV